MTLTIPPQTEGERVETWRLEGLLRAGYSITVALELACRPDIDLHQAVALVGNGCAPETAAAILL